MSDSRSSGNMTHMIEHDVHRQTAEPGRQLFEVAGVNVKLDMPFVSADPCCDRLQIVQRETAFREEVVPHSPKTCAVQALEFRIADVRGHHRDTAPSTLHLVEHIELSLVVHAINARCDEYGALNAQSGEQLP